VEQFHKDFIDLIRLGIGDKTILQIRLIELAAIKTLAERHGLSAVLLDGLDKCNTDLLPATIKLEWIGEVLQNYESRYADYRKRVGELATFYNQHGFKLMVLKGYGLSLNWPIPNHRPCGDIDIYVFGEYKAADAALQKELGIKVENGHHHHTVFGWKGYSVENHYDFVNVHYGHGNAELELVFKDLAKDDNHYVEIDGERVYLPSPNLHALFLLRHCMQDFASAELNMRQVLDWAFLVKKFSNEIDWKWLVETLNRFKMTDFFNCLNAICVGDLGFDVKLFPAIHFDPFLKEKVLNEILEPSFIRDEPNRLIPRLVYKYRRWKGNAWKQELCYHDSRVSSFFTGLWNHLLKPKTI
jgi:hypothetical protein